MLNIFSTYKIEEITSNNISRMYLSFSTTQPKIMPICTTERIKPDSLGYFSHEGQIGHCGFFRVARKQHKNSKCIGVWR